MATTRLRRSRGSLGDSWGDANYESDDEVSLHSASDVGSSSESEREDVPTPLPRRVPKASSRTPQATPVKTPSRKSPSSQSPKYLNRSASHEPSFIMPASPNGYSTPIREAKLHQRRVSRRASGTSNVTPSPRHSVKNSPIQNLASPNDLAESDAPSYFWVLWENIVAPILTYALGVLRICLEQMKPFFAFLLIVGVGVYLLSSGSRIIQSTLYNTLRPVCYVPFVSSVLPFCISGHQVQEPAFEDLVKVQANFEDILHSSAHSFQLPVHMKLSEGSIRDVKNLVKHSKIPSRSELQVEMENFIETARNTAEELTAFNSLIGRSVDKVLNTNRWTLQVLDGLEQQEVYAGALSRFISSLNPVNTFWPASRTIQEKVFDQYVAHADVVTAEINDLIKRGEGVRRLLDYSSDLLDVIADIGARDGLKLNGDRDELFAKLWTKLGGNTRNVKQLNEQLNLLKRVTLSQNRAWHKVQETLLQLQRIRSGLDDLRERVAEPGVVGIKSNIPLRFYLDTIESGVDRLQEARGEARKIEHEGYKWALHEKDPKQLPKPPMKTVEPDF